jgi:ribosomal protein S18 acetylase RimI-like enzyme
MNTVEIRHWKHEDLEAVRKVIWKSWKVTYAAFVPEADLRTYWDLRYSMESMGKMFNDHGVDGFVAESDGRILGCLRTRFDEVKQIFYIISLYVLPDEQKKGIGRLLMAEADKLALEFGLQEIWIGVMVQNKPARTWYEMLGFRFIREEPFSIGKTSVPHLIGFKTLWK